MMTVIALKLPSALAHLAIRIEPFPACWAELISREERGICLTRDTMESVKAGFLLFYSNPEGALLVHIPQQRSLLVP